MFRPHAAWHCSPLPPPVSLHDVDRLPDSRVAPGIYGTVLLILYSFRNSCGDKNSEDCGH
ncbi:hypothetical protein E2C01_027576 [Portunus trituberculatus]|uniref:Uncharacterized protein n=1 Tax=Portunus trituberculatus TaxID=210409 RepID=A0A5B7EL85_PORTR|nr:hypothetical protein [Portunus trituberculatus]